MAAPPDPPLSGRLRLNLAGAPPPANPRPERQRLDTACDTGLGLQAGSLPRSQVTFSTFSHLLSLVVLKISDNPNLVAIEKDAFTNNTWLRHLDVSRTGLTFLDTSTVQDLPNLRILGLSDNLWHCNCSFLDFITWMTESDVHFPDADNITCYTPEGLRALKMPAVEAQLHFNCLTQLYKRDYIFLCLVGFCIFFAGTMAAWLAGICAVVYEVHASKREEEEEEEEEERVT
ncbi:leucine-rich repeat-containing protein 52 [Aegotheles albertisi]